MLFLLSFFRKAFFLDDTYFLRVGQYISASKWEHMYLSPQLKSFYTVVDTYVEDLQGMIASSVVDSLSKGTTCHWYDVYETISWDFF